MRRKGKRVRAEKKVGLGQKRRLGGREEERERGNEEVGRRELGWRNGYVHVVGEKCLFFNYV